MIVTKRAIPRRTVLRGIGTALALPLLDGMVPALAALRNTAANPIRRLGVVYLPNGMAMPYWTPTMTGRAFELTPILQPLAGFREQMVVISGLTQKPPGGEGGGNHRNASTKFLTGVLPTNSVVDLHAGPSMDQFVAKELGQYTQLPSLELTLDARDFAGVCEGSASCAYHNTIAWRDSTTPLPMEDNPRAVFERLFGDGDSTDPTARLTRIQKDRSLLDSVTEKVAALQRRLGPGDRAKIGQFVEAIRDLERRIQKAEEQNARDLPVFEQPSGIPSTFKEHLQLMFDLQVLAYQCDLTRVITFMLGRELSGRTFPEIGVSEPWHPLSHHENIAARVATYSKINIYQATLFKEFLEKMRSTPDGDGSLLDHSLILYGAGMSNSNQHLPDNLPLLLVGGGSGQLKGGRHLAYSRDTPMANLHLALLEKFDVHRNALGDSTNSELERLSDI